MSEKTKRLFELDRKSQEVAMADYGVSDSLVQPMLNVASRVVRAFQAKRFTTQQGD